MTGKIRLDSNNYRKHSDRNKKLIRKSLQEVGAGRSILIDGSGIVRAGNGVYEQAQALGMKIKVIEADADTLIAVQRSDLKGSRAERMGLLDNYTTETSEWDFVRLAELVQREKDALRDMWTDTELNAIQRRAEAEKIGLVRDTEEFKDEHDKNVKIAHKTWHAQEGQLWKIPSRTVAGKNHFILCGDCTNAKDLKKLISSNTVSGIFTSPPYAEQRKDFYDSISMEKYLPWWGKVQAALKPHLSENGSFFLNIKPHCDEGQRVLYVYKLVLEMVEKHGWKLVDELCWVDVGIPGTYANRFKNGFEPVYQFTRSSKPLFFPLNVVQYSSKASFGLGGVARSKQGSIRGDLKAPGMVYPSNVVFAHASTGNRYHSAAFPIGLAEFFVLAYSEEGQVWLDPFLGSGTTILAAERSKRLGLGMEKRPEYVSSSLYRLAEMGLVPEKVA